MEVITYSAKYLPDFILLNREWIETHFKIEPMDIEQLERAEDSIIAKGGEIFFILEEGKVLGTCAMVPHEGPGVYELAKMAVAPSARGKGLGDLLMKTAETWAAGKHAKAIMLLSNTELEAAIALYLKHGYQIVSLGPHPDYERSNIEMIKHLKAT